MATTGISQHRQRQKPNEINLAGINQHYSVRYSPRGQYLPLMLPVILSSVFLGFGPALFAVAASTVIADYLYAVPEYSFAITEWEDAAGLAIFAIIGALLALIVHEFLSFSE